jgi:V/A-type H+-transporting ATPase subunit E
MENKLQELTEKIYSNGIEKARQEAEIILENARKQAAELIRNAKADAGIIKENAEKESAELKLKTESELKLSSKQVISTIKSQVTSLLTNNLIAGDIEKALDESAFLKSVIELMVQKWQPDDAGSINLQIILPENKKEAFEQVIKSKINHLLSKGLSVDFDSQFKSGFKITPADKSYIINFTAEDFDNFFKTYLREKTAGLLYGEE